MKKYSIFGASATQAKDEAPRPPPPGPREWTAMFKVSEPADRPQRPRGQAEAKDATPVS